MIASNLHAVRGPSGSSGRVVGGVILLLALAVGTVVAFRSLVHYAFQGVSPTVAAAIVAAAGTGLLSVVTVVIQRVYERRQAVDQQIRQRKVEVYTDLLTHFFDIFGIGENRSDEESKAVIESAMLRLGKLTPSLIAWASDPVLLAWSQYRRKLSAPGSDPLEAMLGLEHVLLSIRLDLGHSNKDFGRGDLLALWVNDIDEVLAKKSG